MIEAHLAAVKTALLAAKPQMKVYTEPPQSPELLTTSAFPYVVAYLSGGARSTERYAVAPHRAEFGLYTTVVALSRAQADALRSDVIAALALTRLAVPGRVLSRIAQDSDGIPPTRDTDVPDRVIFTAFDHWSFVSTAA